MKPGAGLQRGSAALLWIGIVVWFAATSWLRPLMLPDEGRYVGVAWEMVRSGDWLQPTLNGLPYFHKPPLFYWITATGISVLGRHEWAIRLAPILAASVAALAVFLFVNRWLGPRTARAALAALLVQPLFFLGAQYANTDMLVAGCITVCILCLAHAALCIEYARPHRAALSGAYAAAALGVLSKGLIGLVLPAGVLGVWLLARGQWRTLIALIWLPGILILCAVCMPWFMLMQQHNPGFLDYFFVEHHVRRYAAGGFNNVRPIWFYPVYLTLASLPCLPWLMRLRRPHASRSAPLTPSDRNAAPAEALARKPTSVHHTEVLSLMSTWLGFVVVFFSIPQSKLIGYILPAIPALAVLFALAFLNNGEPSPRAQRWWRASLFVSGLAGAAVVLGVMLHPPESFRELSAELADRRQPGEPVLMLDHYYFDAQYYAALKDPVQVFAAWNDPALVEHDSWPKELVDAARFSPRLGAKVLPLRSRFASSLCAAPVNWVIAAPEAMQEFPALKAAQQVASTHHGALWRVDRTDPAMASVLACAQP